MNVGPMVEGLGLRVWGLQFVYRLKVLNPVRGPTL